MDDESGPTSSERSLPRVSMDEEMTELMDAEGLRVSRNPVPASSGAKSPMIPVTDHGETRTVTLMIWSEPSRGSESDMAKPTPDEHRPGVVPTEPPPPPPKKLRAAVKIAGAIAAIGIAVTLTRAFWPAVVGYFVR